MKVIQGYNNFARGQVDPDMAGRYDLPIYNSSCEIVENFLTNFKGNLTFRTGFLDMVGEFQDCALYLFKFRDDQNYIMVFYNTKVRFLTYDSGGVFGWVGAPLELTTPYSLAESKELSITQNGDVVIIAHPDYDVRKITRTGASTFTIGVYSYTPSTLFSSGYPSCALFYKGRLYFSRDTTIWASADSDYDEFTIPTTVTDTSPLKFTLTDIQQPINWLFGGDNSLIVGADDGVVAVNGGSVGAAITASTIEATLTSAPGANSVYPIRKDGLVFYVGKEGRNIYTFSYDILTETFTAADANFISYDITESGIKRLAYIKGRVDLVLCLLNNGDICALNFNKQENIVGWSKIKSSSSFKDLLTMLNNDGKQEVFVLADHDGDFFIERQEDSPTFPRRDDFFTGDEQADTEAYIYRVSDVLSDCIYLDCAQVLSGLQESNTITYNAGSGTITASSSVFSSGDVGKHIVYKTATGYDFGRFEITGYTSGTVVSVRVLIEPQVTTADDWYLTFSSVSGLSLFNGKTVSVVADGGYVGDFVVSGGTISIGTQVGCVVVGYKYEGLAKSFNLGFSFQGKDTHITMKTVAKATLLFHQSAGGQFGTSLYRMKDVQNIRQGAINYLPPIPMNTQEDVFYGDTSAKDKRFYIKQPYPLPMSVLAVLVDSDYAVV